MKKQTRSQIMEASWARRKAKAGTLEEVSAAIKKMGRPQADLVNHPPHYTRGKFEVIEVLEEFFDHDPLLWQVGKYIMRAGHKDNTVQDLEKAAWYLQRKITKLKGDGHE